MDVLLRALFVIAGGSIAVLFFSFGIFFSRLGLLATWKWLVANGAKANSHRSAGFTHLLPGIQVGRGTAANVHDLAERP